MSAREKYSCDVAPNVAEENLPSEKSQSECSYGSGISLLDSSLSNDSLMNQLKSQNEDTIRAIPYLTPPLPPSRD